MERGIRRGGGGCLCVVVPCARCHGDGHTSGGGSFRLMRYVQGLSRYLIIDMGRDCFDLFGGKQIEDGTVK